MIVERIASGIPGLDKLIEGGFVKGSSNLVAGTTGTGKTILSCQYLLHGLQKGENGIYVTLEQKEEDIIADMGRFGWDVELKKFINAGKLIMTSRFPSNIKELTSEIVGLVKRNSAKRLVLDSISIATMGWKETTELSKLRAELFDFIKTLKNLGVTSLLVTEIPEDRVKSISRFGFEEFLADGIILLHYLEYAAGGTPRSLVIRKMRRTIHGSDIYPMEITKAGIVLKPMKE